MMKNKGVRWKHVLLGMLSLLLVAFQMGNAMKDFNVVQAAEEPVQPDAIYRIVNVATGRCMDVPNGSNENYVQLQTYTGNGTAAQQFKFEKSMDEGYYVIVPECAQVRAIDNPNATHDEGAIYQLYIQNGNEAQEFRLESVGDGAYRIINRVSNQALYDDEKVKQGPIAADTRQYWRIEKVSDDDTLTNPVKYDGADPWVILVGDTYYMCQTNNDIVIYKTNELENLGSVKGTSVFSPTGSGDASGGFWAPELMYLQGRWYVYFAGEYNNGGNDSHRMYVLEGGTNPNDPLDGEYKLKGKIYDTANDRWAIDGTVFTYNGQMYFVWSGWEGTENVAQNIYIATMSNPWTLSSNRVCISQPNLLWENNEFPAVNEGPQVLIKNNAVHIIYSASGSWTDNYCLGRLTCTDGNFMNPSSWSKSNEPLFKKTDSVFGVGHCSFVKSKDGTEDWLVYHAAKKQGSGWDRDIRAQIFTWEGDYPYFGEPVSSGVKLANPSKDSLNPVDTNAYYEIVNVATGKCLDIPDGADANSLQLQTWEGNDSNAQRFLFKESGTAGWYVIVPKCATGRALDNPSASKNKNVTYQTWEQNGANAQNFRLEEMPDGTWRIVNQASLLALADASASGGKVEQQTISNDDNQKWRLNKVENNNSDLYAKAAAIPGTGAELYSNTLVNGDDMAYYAGTSQSVPRYENNTLIIGGGNANKVVVKDKNFTNFVYEADIKVSENITSSTNQGGLIFRVTNPTTGVNDGYNGYYFGIDAAKGEAILGKVNGNTWTQIATKRMTVKYDTYYHVAVTVHGNQITCYVNYNGSNYAKIVAVDDEFTSGSVGVRQWMAGAAFKNLKVSEYTPETLTESYTNSLVDTAADPDILYHDGVYYLYATYTAAADVPGFKVYTSTDLVNWTDKGWALKSTDVYGEGGFWAPDLIEKDGIFYMYYTADEHLSVATSTSPLGPFTQTEAQKVPMHDSKEIDAHVYQDDDGQYYIYFVRFSNGNHIYGAKLNSDMRTMDESTITLLISPEEAWETNMANITEGPFMLKKDGTYYLTYSGSHFESSMYGCGYATSNSPLGTYSKYRNNPIMQSNSIVHGAGHHCVTQSPDGSEMYIVYHRHYSLTQTDPRRLCIDKMQFTTDDDGNTVLEVYGPTITAQPMPSAEPKDISIADAVVTLSGADAFIYDGTVKIPEITVTVNGNVVPAEAYEVQYTSSNSQDAVGNVSAGTVTVTVVAKEGSGYTGTVTNRTTYEIRKATVVAPPERMDNVSFAEGKKVKDISLEAYEGWSWSEDSRELTLIEGESVQATAVYKDTVNIANATVVVSITMASCAHDEAVLPAEAATCTKTGKTEGSYCTLCGEIVVEQQIIPATGHVWDDGNVTVEPTASTDGVRTYHCNNCDEIKTESIPATGEESTETPGSSEEGTDKPGTSEESTETPGSSEEGTDKPGTSEESTEEPGSSEEGTDKPGTSEESTEEPGSSEEGTDKPGTSEESTEEPGSSEEGTDKPETGEESTETPGSSEEGTDKPGTGEESTETPGSSEEGTDKPGTGEESTETPGSSEEGTDKPGTSEESTETPGTSEEKNEKPGTNGGQAETPGTDGSDITIPAAGTTIVDNQYGGVYKVVNASATEGTIEYSSSQNKQAKAVVIPSTITINGVAYKVVSIAPNAFKGNSTITNVTIGDNVISIGANAFANCKNLKSVKIGKNVKTIAARAFYKCKKLTSITIPSTVTSIGKQAFYGCKKLKKITIKTKKLTSKMVGAKAFKGIYTKANIKVPKKKLNAYKKMLRSKGVSSKAKIKK